MSISRDSEKRDFVAQTAELMSQNSEVLIGAGFDPASRIEQLKAELDATEVAEAKQKQAQAAAMDATELARDTLTKAYNDASASINLIEGLLGKDNSLVHKLRQLRK